ncbi:hypothetical protein JXA34_00985 [Patescibacteria group bacterium]|nr:hypothetical protein [Patescibacteria group bacterium]
MKILDILLDTFTALKEKGLKHVVKVITDVAGGNLHNCFWYTYGKVFNKTVVHVIGDSHVRVFKGQKRFIIHHLGPATAYNLSSKHSTTDSNEKFWNVVDTLVEKKKDKILLVFGEIDSRIHIYKAYKKKGSSIDDVIYATISRYDEVLSQLNERGYTFYVHGIPPGSKQENIYNVSHYPTPEMRAKINKRFHEVLEEHCKKRGYKYIDVYMPYVNEEGFIKREYELDEVHLNNRIIPEVKRAINFY